MINEIVKLFEEVGCPAILVMETPQAGEEVDNGCGMDFELARFAVIHEGNIHERDKNGKSLGRDSIIYAWQHHKDRGDDIDIMKFNVSNCRGENPEALSQELHDRDGYEIKYRKPNK